jgi:signal transduction histidine kinase
MYSKLAMKISVAIVGVVGLALSGSVIALLAAWHVGGLMQDAVSENVSSLRAAEELEIALLERRNQMISFILDQGNSQRLKDYQRQKDSFHDALAQARKTAHTISERKILDDLEENYREYDEKRNEMIALSQRGDKDQAITLYLNEVNRLFQQVDRLSRGFIAENKRTIDSTTAHAQRRVIRITWVVAGFSALTIGLGVLLAWLFFHSVLNPLRQMVADARKFAGQRSATSAEIPLEEIPAVGEYLHSLMSDVSDARTALDDNHRRMLNAEKLATVGKLAAGVAHEIRNPLTAIKMWLFSIRKATGDDPEIERKFEIVSEELTRMEKIVSNFLEFSRLPALKQEALSVSALVHRTLELFSHRIEEKKLSLACLDAERLPLVMVDADQFKQVLNNVLDNAIEATNVGGEIQVSVAKDHRTSDQLMVVVRVRDNGKGISQDVCEKIFEPFYTTKDDGTGLGLCIAAQIMAKHGGSLELESSTKEGTTFAVWIPIARKDFHEQNISR